MGFRKNMRLFKTVFLIICLLCFFAPASGQDLSQDFRTKVDAIVAEAYAASMTKFPCALKTRGNPKMLRWQDVDKCLNDAAAIVDWEPLARKLQDLRRAMPGYLSDQIEDVLAESLAAQAIPYEKAFKVKDTGAFLPLTNSLLRFLPPDALENLAVFDSTGAKIGSFAGTYTYERKGGSDSLGAYKLTLFQYSDLRGDMQASPDQLLLDSFSVSWADAAKKQGFCLQGDKLLGRK